MNIASHDLKIKNIKEQRKGINFYPISFFLLFTFSLTWNVGQTQNYDLLDIPFTENGKSLLNPFTGGFEGAQVCNIDINLDGILDLLIFDRRGNVPVVFVNDGLGNGSNSYKMAVEYESQLPTMYNWVSVVDYNNDGIDDIFTSGDIANSVGIFKGIIVNNKYQFERYNTPGFISGAYPYNILTYIHGGKDINLVIPPGDRPAIEDFDGDGDIDIAAFDTGTHIWYFKNTSVENGQSLDSLFFDLNTDCFGGIYESGLDEEIFLSPKPDSCSQGFWNGNIGSGVRHAGSTLLAFDEDGDSDFELLVGDLSSSKMVLLTNGGTPESAWFNDQDARFPSYDFSIDLDFFPGAFYEEVTNDGKRDLLVAPNGINSIINTDNIWLYENVGEDDVPDFILRQKNFITETTIDQGDHSDPNFVDVNQDGLYDLLIVSEGPFQSASSHTIALKYYVNVGSKDSPSFELADNDYLNFSQYQTTSTFPNLTFEDMDNDQDLDLIAGDHDGKFYYFENIAGVGNVFDFKSPIYYWMGIDIGGYAAPFVYDLDKDGLKDLIIGNRLRFSQESPANPDDVINSSIHFYKNIGTLEQPMFNPDLYAPINNYSLGGMSVKTPFATQEYGTPFVVDCGEEALILTGSDDGHIFIFKSNQDSIDFGRFELIDDSLGGIYDGPQSVISLADIDDDGYLEMAVGNFRGGLAIYNTLITTTGQITATEDPITNVKELKIFPNPSKDYLIVELENLDRVEVYNLEGKLLFYISGENKIDLSSLQSGMYFIKAYSDKQLYTSKFLKIN